MAHTTMQSYYLQENQYIVALLYAYTQIISLTINFLANENIL